MTARDDTTTTGDDAGPMTTTTTTTASEHGTPDDGTGADAGTLPPATPPVAGVVIAAAAAVLAAAAAGAATVTLPAGLLGALAVGVGTARRTGSLVTIGFLAQFVAVVIAGLAGLGAEALLVATAAAIIAWDAGTQAIDLGEHLRTGDGTRPLLAHVAATAAVVALASGAGYLVFRVAGGGRPVAALALLLLGTLVILVGLR